MFYKNLGLMKQFLFLIFINILFSCHNKDNKEVSKLFYSVDTLIINSDERIFDLGGFMITSDLDKEKKLFYLYNDFDLSIDQISFDEEKFIEKYSFDPEGPNGVGTHLLGIQILNDSLFFLKSFNKSAIVNKKGYVWQRINWMKSTSKNIVNIGNIPRIEIAVYKKDLIVYGLKFDYKNKQVSLAKLSVAENLEKPIDIDPKNSFENYFLTYEGSKFLAPQVFISSQNGFIMISHEFSNEIILLDNNGDLKKIVTYKSSIIPSRAEIPTIKDGEKEQISKIYQGMLEQIRFEAPVWDEVDRRYFRLSSKRIFEQSSKNENGLLSKKLNNEVFLSVLDENFELISELKIKELAEERYKYFAKNGKLWVSQNFSDELGFLIFSFKNIK
jgi:hypothetical protein